MGYAFCTGPCIGCGILFTFNPVKVPSSSAITGQREPICRPCFDRINARRKQMGLAPFPLHPDAYEACEEGELS
jgi:hypothetical protein